MPINNDYFLNEKIKIYVSKDIKDILFKDMLRFEIFKKNSENELNKNHFYNLLIRNYSNQFELSQNEREKEIKQRIKNYTEKITEYELEQIAISINEYLEKKEFGLDCDDSYKEVLTYKPDKDTSSIVQYIQKHKCNYISLSAYFRNMFASYASLPQDKRERIIFNDSIEIIEDAIKSKKQLYFVEKYENNKSKVVSPYAVTNSKEELYNYLVCKDGKEYKSHRINRICNLKKHNALIDISLEDEEVLEKMIKNAPQYAYGKNELGCKIKVRLTEKGLKNYRNIYLNRPEYDKETVENDIYTFECPSVQAFQYFARFGKEATILEPKKLVNNIYQFHREAIENYQEYIQEDESNCPSK